MPTYCVDGFKANIPEIIKVSNLPNEPINNAYLDLKNYIDSVHDYNLWDIEPFSKIAIGLMAHLASCGMYLQCKINFMLWKNNWQFFHIIMENEADKSQIPTEHALKFSSLILKKYDSALNELNLSKMYNKANALVTHETKDLDKFPIYMSMVHANRKKDQISYREMLGAL